MNDSRLIIGDGKVSKIIRRPNDIIIARDQCDITVLDDVVSILGKLTFNGTVINCAAKAGLEWCSQNKDEAYKVNTVGAANILRACELYGHRFVHISTGCIFDGNDVLTNESTIPNPAVWYTKTKFWADDYIMSYGYDDYLILRPRQMISAKKHPTNMITKFLSRDVIKCHDEENSVTCIEDFSLMIDHLLKINARGVYNCTNVGVTSPYEIASMVKKYLKPDMEVQKISYSEMSTVVPEKRVNVILSTEKLSLSGLTCRSASEALEWCVQNYG